MSGTRAQRRAVMTARRWRILRRWIYSVSIAAIPLGGIYLKLIPAEAAPVILPGDPRSGHGQAGRHAGGHRVIPDPLEVALVAMLAMVLAGLIAAGGVTISIQLIKWKMENQRLWSWNRALQDHIYRGGSPPPPPAAPPGLFD